MMLVLGMFSGGNAYSRKITITNAVREASRYGATLPVGSSMDDFLFNVGKSTLQNAGDDLKDGVDARAICVAYVYPANDATSSTVDRTFHMSFDSSAFPVTTPTATSGRCTTASGDIYTDGFPDSERRVNVVASRKSRLEFLLAGYDLTLEDKSATRFEAIG
jgi:Flp pilus assembly protein TadG